MALEYCVLLTSTVVALGLYALTRSFWFLAAVVAAWAVFLLLKQMQYQRHVQDARQVAVQEGKQRLVHQLDQPLVHQLDQPLVSSKTIRVSGPMPLSLPQHSYLQHEENAEQDKVEQDWLAQERLEHDRPSAHNTPGMESTGAHIVDPAVATMERINRQFERHRTEKAPLTIDGKALPTVQRPPLALPAKGLLPTMDAEPYLDAGAEKDSCINMDRFIAYDKRFFEQPYNEEEERNLPDPFPDFFQEPNADSIPGPYSVVVTDSDRIYNADLNAMGRDWITSHVQQQAQMERDAIRGRYSLMREITKRNTGRKDHYGQSTGIPTTPIPVATPPIATSDFLYV